MADTQTLPPGSRPPSTCLETNHRRLSLRFLASSLEIAHRDPAHSPFLHPEASSSFAPRSSRAEHSHSSHGSPRPPSRHSPSYDKFVRARRPASLLSTKSSEYDPSTAPWKQKSLLTRISWGWEQTFSGLSPTALTEVTLERARPKQVDISSRRQSLDRRSSIISSDSTFSQSSFASAQTVKQQQSPRSSTKILVARTSSSESSQPTPSINSNTEEIDHSLFTVEESDDSHLGTLKEEQAEEQAEDDMGIARSLTNRLRRSESSSSGLSFRAPIPIPERKRPAISLPTLLHTTNQFIRDNQEEGGARSSFSTAPSTPTSEAPSLSNTSSRSSSDGSPMYTPAPNHLTQYFTMEPTKTPEFTIVSVSPSTSESGDPDVIAIDSAPPAIPRRAPSHSKREHVRLARQRSVRSSTNSGTFVSSTGSPNSSRHASVNAADEHPLSAELAQLDEVVEDFNSLVLDSLAEEDERVLAEGGFAPLRPSVYLDDLADLEKMRWMD